MAQLPSPAMTDRRAHTPDRVGASVVPSASGPQPPDQIATAGELDLDRLPLAGITRRRIALVVAAVVTAWIVIAITRQVGEAAAATARAEQAAIENAELASEVSALERELQLIGRQPYILQQARAYGLGGAQEIPFELPPDTPPVAADAPGSATQRLGVSLERRSPLDSWLSVLFGPTPGD
jgi:cell division protein FtsB